jgi:hypothetical protein
MSDPAASGYHRRMVLRALRRFLIDRGGLVALAALVAYVWLAPAYIVDGDNAEFATVGTVGGVAHPTGYPAYLLWLRATSWLPGSSPAHTTAIATAILAAIQLLVLHAACRAWGARPVAATFAVAIYAAGPVAMRYSTEAEVFALNQLVVATVLYLAAREGPMRGGRRVAALGLVAGIGLADHVTCVLVAPVGLLGAIRGIREAKHAVGAAAAGVLALAIGLAPYAYLFITPEGMSSWSKPHDAGDLIDHVLRRAYGGPGAFAAGSGTLHPVANLLAFAVTLGRAWWWIAALAGVAALAVRSVRNGRGEPCVGWQALALAFVVAGPVLAARFNINPSGLSLYVARRFHLMPTLLLGVPVACAFDVAVARVERWLRAEVAAAIAVLGFATAAILAVPDLMRVRTPAFDHAIRGMLRGLPPNAVVFTSGDLTFLGTGYFQVALGDRPDVVVVLWKFVATPWYRARLARRGLVIDTTKDATPSVRNAEKFLASGRPVFVDQTLNNVLQALPSYPYGTLFRILPRGESPPSIDQIAALNRDWFAALDLDYPRPGPDDEYPTIVHKGYATTWRIIAEGFTVAGKPDEAENAAALRRELGPLP